MKVVVASHPSFWRHDTGAFHPERPERLDAVRKGLSQASAEVETVEPSPVTRSDLALVHDPTYVETIEAYCSLGGGALDMDTAVSEESWEAALTSAGAVKRLAEILAENEDVTGFALCRPPGHHALTDRAMGFCLFNNVAVTAALLRADGEKVAILDWDVHHGNGTQAMVSQDPGVLYVSVHQSGHYPHEGVVDDIESGAKGTVVNLPLPPGTAGDCYRRAWQEIVLPVTSQFDPDWILVSASYDAHANDPLAGFALTHEDYGWLAQTLGSAFAANRIILALEGGYDLEALRLSSTATVDGLTGAADFTGTVPQRSPATSEQALGEAAAVIGRHWSI